MIYSMENETIGRVARGIIDFFSHEQQFQPSVSGASSQIHMALGDSALTKKQTSPIEAGMNTASQLIEDAGEVIRSPVRWMKSIQANWLTYIVCAAIICVSIFLVYCWTKKFLVRKNKTQPGLTSQLADLASIMANSYTAKAGNPIPAITAFDSNLNKH